MINRNRIIRFAIIVVLPVISTFALFRLERVFAVFPIPDIEATKTDTLLVDVDNDGLVDPGDTLLYTVGIANNGNAVAENVNFSDILDANSTISGTAKSTPLAIADGYDVIGNTTIVISATNGVLSGNASDFGADRDPDGGSVTANAVAGGSTSQGGSLELLSTGAFTYTPPAGFTGTDVFTYTITDDEGETDTDYVTFTISDMVWFVDSSQAANGDGTQRNPFNTLTSLSGADPDGDGDIIFLFERASSYESGITLEDNQKLIGQGVDLATAAGLSVPLGTTLPAATSNPTITNGAGDVIILANANVVAGLTVSGGNHDGIYATGKGGSTHLHDLVVKGNGGVDLHLVNHTGDLTFEDGTVMCITSYAVSIEGGSAQITFDNSTISHSLDTAVYIAGTTGGSVKFENGTTISEEDGTGIQIVNATGDVEVEKITTTNGRALEITGGSGNFQVDDLTVNGSTNGGIYLANNTGTTIFNHIEITTTASTALYASTAGNVTLNGSANEIDATNGTGLDISTTTLSGMWIFRKLSASNSPTYALNLVDVIGSITGNSGSLNPAVQGKVNVDGGSVNLTYKGNITTNTNSPLVIVQGGHTGTLLFDTGTLMATAGEGLKFDNADGSYSFNGPVTLNGGDAGIDILNGSAGTFNFSNQTSITNPSGVAFNINNSPDGNVTYNGTISQNTTASAVTISGKTGGTVAFNGAITANTGGFNAVNLTNNTGATIHFGGMLDIDTTSGTGFNATGGGTISVTGSGSTIHATAGIGANIVGTTLGASGVSFQSISSANATHGINLVNTGASGSFNVTGTGTPGTGGTLNAHNAEGIRLNNVPGGFSIDRMVINQSGKVNTQGMDAMTVTGLSILNSTITAAAGSNSSHALLGTSITNWVATGSIFNGGGGNVTNIAAVHITNLHGTNTLTGSTFQNGKDINLLIENTTNSGVQDTLTISNATFNTSAGNDHLQVDVDYTANLKLVFNGSSGVTTFTGTGQDGIQLKVGGSAIFDAIVTAATFSGNSGSAVRIAAAGSGNMTARVHNLTGLVGGSTDVINVVSENTSTINVTIENNTITSAPSGHGINVFQDGNGIIIAKLDNNTIGGIGFGNGISVQGSFGTGDVNATISNNHVTVDSTAQEGIQIVSGDNGGGSNTVCLNMLGNTSVGGFFSGYRLAQKSGSTFQLQDYFGGTVQSWVNTTKSNTGTVSDAGTFNSAPGNCATPVLPTASINTSYRVAQVDVPVQATVSRIPIQKSISGGLAADRSTQIVRTPAQIVDSLPRAPVTSKFADDTASLKVQAKPAAAREASIGYDVDLNIGDLPPGKSVTITFQATVNDPLPADTFEVCNQGTVSGDNFSDVLTDDPDVGGATDPTCSQLSVTKQCNLQNDTTYTFNPAGMVIRVTIPSSGLGTIHCIDTSQTGSAHPSATLNMTDGFFWTIDATQPGGGDAGGFSITLTLPHQSGTNPTICFYPGSLGGDGWDCTGTQSVNGSNVIREGITHFSDWAIGYDVGPTNLEVVSFSAESGANRQMWVIVLGVFIGLLLGIRVYQFKRSVH